VFIVMEYIRHGDLGSYLKGPFPEDEAREVTFQVAEGLEHLHENGFVHRDLKPEVSRCYSPVE
jgi:serine/threonine protein kinase